MPDLSAHLFVTQDKSDDLEQSPTRLDDLKFVLSTISEIKTMSLEVETRIRDITEKYRTLSMYGIEVSWITKTFFVQLDVI